MTQSDRDLFKHLISEATAYVAADYMRYANERRVHLDNALTLRRDLLGSRKQLASEQYRHVDMARELAEISGGESDLETDYQAVSDHLNLVQTAMRQQEKIGRYQEDLEELTFRLEEQNEVVAEAASSRFEQAYGLVVNIAGQISRSDAWQTAWELIRDAASQRHQAERLQALRSQLNELEQRLREQQDPERLMQEFCQRMGQDYPAEELDAVQQELDARVETLSATVSEAGECRLPLRQTLEQVTARIEQLTARAPAWLVAQDALTALSEQSGEALTSSRQVTDTMQLYAGARAGNHRGTGRGRGAQAAHRGTD